MASDHYCLSSPATEIRLLDLLDPTPSGALSGQVRRVPIGQPPPFISVSHVWGQNQADQSMYITSGCGNRNISISRNLESFLIGLLCHTPTTLPHLWSNGSRLPMWIDMACINQADLDEKVCQIPLMRQIYSQATSVFIWIHEYDSHIRYAFHYIRQLLETGIEGDGDPPRTRFDPIGWDAIKRLLQCEWFNRRWVIQEAVISAEVIILCVSDYMNFDDFLRGVDHATTALVARPKSMKMLKVASTGEVRPLLAMRKLRDFARSSRHLSLLWLLENLRFTRASLAHDQVYGLLGFCSLSEAAGNPIQYHRSAEEAYQICVMTHAQLYNDLNFLGLCTHTQKDTISDDLSGTCFPRPFEGPSWVPNWHSRYLRRCLGLGVLEHDQTYFNASATLPVEFAFDQNKLIVSGVLVDRIQALADFSALHRKSDLSDPDAKVFQDYFDFWAQVADRPAPYGERGAWARAFTRTLSLMGVYLNPVPRPDDIPTMFWHWCRNTNMGNQLEGKALSLPEVTDNIDQRGFARMKRLSSWRPFITVKGYIGLAREEGHVDDEIWIIGGCSVPVLLSSADQREVRGEVFLDGFMFGEIGGIMDRISISKATLV
ncbi:uncharacterized protein JN550_002310 [Neoarthrinium moseri]|uniref:uncharacterized protein n=1 Tax=Neoarthrinium moseri TaxID=1658444 RepID=UPI001FDEA283|nr:uncharacterized protein JN550_002310 [Neoarthrinium moseri]KAI1874881.1 hypothetical protein JN550_002310 [Neoarthrinium moseri]